MLSCSRRFWSIIICSLALAACDVAPKFRSADITGADYGTRSSTVVTFSQSGGIAFEERTLSPEGHATQNRRESLQVQPA